MAHGAQEDPVGILFSWQATIVQTTTEFSQASTIHGLQVLCSKWFYFASFIGVDSAVPYLSAIMSTLYYSTFLRAELNWSSPGPFGSSLSS